MNVFNTGQPPKLLSLPKAGVVLNSFIGLKIIKLRHIFTDVNQPYANCCT